MWPQITYETYEWNRDPDDLAFIPKSRRRKILPTYEAAIPASIASANVSLPSDLLQRIAEVEVSIARFDEAQESRGYNLPALMLRSESSSSSQIERLTSSARNIALAALSDKAPANAKLIAGNIAAMDAALGQDGPIGLDLICKIHDALLRGEGEALGIRDEQAWIGGTPYSPHGALFVPPHATRLRACLDDLISFGSRLDVNPVAKAAVFHAQFETIHPFADGNGRTGRALIHRMLADDEVLLHATLPISAGLLHEMESYMDALDAYHAGDPLPMVNQLVDALELAVVVGNRMAADVDGVLGRWLSANGDRRGSASYELPSVLIAQPVVNAGYVAERLGISERAARSVIEAACERGILAKIGNAERGAFYQAIEIIDILEEASSIPGIRRIAAR